MPHRVSRVIDTRYAVPDPKGISTSGRVEETHSFFKKIHNVIFLKKE